ncbi:MAG: polysaccharide biosynthesis tyrosine autokinase, partial [Novosphingobium sp.]|nr:polysaccharide biosynthesis tyrosine autokinase [Novosphingobium sp.]
MNNPETNQTVAGTRNSEEALFGDTQGLSLPPILIQYWHTAMRWRWLMLGIVVAALVIGILATLLMAPQFTAQAQLQIDRQQKQITNVEGVEAIESARDMEFYATQYALLETRPLIERVANELKLAENAQFFEAHGVDFSAADGDASNRTPAEKAEARRKKAVELLMRNVQVTPIRNSRLVNITYTSRSPTLSAQIANKWATAFIAISIDRQFASTADARKFLESRLDTLRKRVEDSERQVMLYGSKSGIVSLNQVRDEDGKTVANRTLASEALEQLSTTLNQATADRVAAQSRARGDGSDASEAVVSSTLAGLRQERARAAAEYSESRVVFAEEYPQAKEQAERLATLDAAIARETARIAAARKREFKEASTQEKLLGQKVSTLRAELDRQNRANIQYNIYQREADTNRQLYDALLQRYKEIGVAGAVSANNIAIVEPAIVPDVASSPNLVVNVALSLFLGLLGAGLAAVILEQIDEGIREPAQLEPTLGVPLLGVTPAVDGDVVEQIYDPKSQLYDACFSVRSNLTFATSHGFPRSLSILSTRPAEGKSSMALALAVILSRTGKRILLVDGDLRNPSVHQLFSAPNKRGFSNYLSGDDEWAQLTQTTESDNLTILSSGPVPPSAAELLSGDRLGQFVKEALEEFDHVVFDSPPILGMTDATMIAKAVEGVVYVVQSGGAAV